MRVATFNVELERDGPGLLLRDIRKGDEQAAAAAAIIRRVAPDILLLTGFDYDFDLQALRAFNEMVGAYPHLFASRPNTGMATGLDLDGDGRVAGPRDAQGFGAFSGQGGMAVLSRVPITLVRDFSDLLWRDVPGNRMPTDFYNADAQAVLRLSTTAHWHLRAETESGALNLLAFHASPPVFDGPEDRNGRRNADELDLWTAYLDGVFDAPPSRPFIVIGDANLDPADGDGMGIVMREFLARDDIQDPKPGSPGGQAAANPGHKGNPALDTADWRDPSPGNLRVDYVLPSADLEVRGAGVFWPAPGEDLALESQAASRHRLVWVDVIMQGD